MALTKQRARRAEDKAIRRRDIMQAALTLLDQHRFAEIKMIDIAREAGLAKGTLFLYFPTKETLFLEILEERLAEWLSELNRQLEAEPGPWGNQRMTQVFVETLVARDILTRLLTLVSSALEQNVDFERVVGFKSKLLALLAPTGALLETRLGFLGPGAGVHLLLRLYAVVVGLRQLCDPGPVARQALTRPEFAPLAIEFSGELQRMIEALLLGLEQASSAEQ